MNPTYDFNHDLTAWLVEEAPAKAPPHVLEGALARADDVTQRPVWLLPESWVPLQATMRLATVSRGAIYALFIVILALLLAITVFVLGQQQRLPPPLGLAANGLIADDARGLITLYSPTGDVVKVLTTSVDIAVRPTFSPDGRKVAFWSIPRPADVPPSAPIDVLFGRMAETPASIFVVDLASGLPTKVASNVKMGFAPLAWSHASDAIAYGTFVSAGHDVVFVTSSSGEQLGQIDLSGEPAWSPDDSQIAVSKANVGVFLANREGTVVTRLSEVLGLGLAFVRPDWSPDGTHIAFVAGGDALGGYKVYVANTDGLNETQVADVIDGRDASWPRFSPDGKKLAYQRTAADNPDLVNWIVADPDGSNPQVLPVDLWVGGGWSPDGRYLVGYDGEADAPNIVLINVRSGEIQRIPSSGSTDISWQRLAP